jgi:N6-L-threonylcarbamoyladenine synthase
MNVLAIETSCDDTSCSIITDDYKLLSLNISSQNDIHSQFGGVVPEVASRQHLKMLPTVFKKTLHDANLSLKDIDGITATIGPGLIGSLLVGIMFAKGLSIANKKPFFAVNHIEGHFFASYLEEKKPDFPFVALVASGGHTALYLVNDFRDYKLIGQTRDDAAGEAFDKVAKLLNIGYPGGVAIEKLAEGVEGTINLPYPLEREDDFSFSGLKTAVLTIIKKNQTITEDFKKDLCASFQKTVVKILVDKTIRACKKFKIKKIVI